MTNLDDIKTAILSTNVFHQIDMEPVDATVYNNQHWAVTNRQGEVLLLEPDVTGETDLVLYTHYASSADIETGDYLDEDAIELDELADFIQTWA